MKKALPFCFVLFEGLLWAYFTVIDIFQPEQSTVWVKYAGILICVLFSGVLSGFLPCRDGLLVFSAQLLTAFADLFLLVLNRDYPMGVGIFCVVQFFYFLRLKISGNRSFRLSAILRLVLTALMWGIVFFSGEVSLLNLLVGIYFPNLLVNAVDAVRRRRKTFRDKLFAAGLVLFVCCDICVGLFNISGAVGLPYSAEKFVSAGMWFFYLPSQVLISLSCLRFNDEKAC